MPIRVTKYPVNFRNVLANMGIILTLWSGDRRVYDPDCKEGQKIYINAVLHLVMNVEDFWEVVRVAYRDGYAWVGNDGVVLPKHNGEKGRR